MPAGFSASDFYYLLPELMLTGGALLVLLADVLMPKRRGLLMWLSMATVVVTTLAVASFAGVETTSSRGLLAIDDFALFFKVVFLLSAAVTILMSARYLEIEHVGAGEYYFLILCATLGMMFMASGIDLITIFIGLETMAVSFYILAGYLKPNRRSNEASVKYFLLGAFSLGILLYGMSLMYGLTGTTNLRQIADVLQGQERSALLVLAISLVGAGVGFKIAAVPFHMWAPDVYEGAPTPVTAFMSTGVKAAGFAALVRVFLTALGELRGDWAPILWVLAVLTMTVGNVVAIAQQNVKRMLAYSSIAHAGYLLIALVAGNAAGFTGLLYYLLAYTFMNLGAFAVVVALEQREDRYLLLGDYAGLGFRYPLLGVAMVLCMFSLSGLPPTAGFMSKFYVFSAAVEQGYIGLAIIGVLNSLISIYYYLYPLVLMYMEEPKAEMPVAQLNRSLVAALVLTMAGTIYLGLSPAPLLSLAEAAAQGLLGR